MTWGPRSMSAPPPASSGDVNHERSPGSRPALPRGPGVVDPSDALGAQVVGHPLHVGAAPVVEGCIEHAARPRRGVDHRLGALGGHGERLLAEDVLAALQRGDGQPVVEDVGGGDADDVEVVAGDEFVAVGVGVGDPVLGGQQLQSLPLLAGERDDLDPGEGAEGLEVRGAGVAEADDADTQGVRLAVVPVQGSGEDVDGDTKASLLWVEY